MWAVVKLAVLLSVSRVAGIACITKPGYGDSFKSKENDFGLLDLVS
jgi:hypothetical protein